MSSTILQRWTDRILDRGKLGTTCDKNWKLVAYEEYKAKLRTRDYPCFFGQAGEERGEMLYTFISDGGLEELVPNMWQFVTLFGTPGYERTSLVAFLEPDHSITDHASFVDRFWHILQFLHEHDRHPATGRTPGDSLWEFSFEGCEMFVVGASPTYLHRRSRNLGQGIILIFQPRPLFVDPATSLPIAAPVRHRIHQRMLAYDGMPVHPDIGFYGNPTNREWKQYALPDDNEPEHGTCPFQARTADGL